MGTKNMIDSRYSIEYVSEEPHKGKQLIKMSISTLVLAGLALTTSSLLLYNTLTAEAASTKAYKVAPKKIQKNTFNTVSKAEIAKKQAVIQALLKEKESIKNQLTAETQKHSLQVSASNEQSIINKELAKELEEIKKQLALEKENSAILSREVEIKIIENQTLSLLLNEDFDDSEPTRQVISSATEITQRTELGEERAVKPTPIAYKVESTTKLHDTTSGLSQVDAIIEAIKNAKK